MGAPYLWEVQIEETGGGLGAAGGLKFVGGIQTTGCGGNSGERFEFVKLQRLQLKAH